MHKTKNINDDYMGSGTILKRKIKKYGLENFDKKILFIFNNKKNMIDKEKELVNEEFIKRKDTYNLKVGGDGGWDYVNSIAETLDNGFKYINKNKLNNKVNQCYITSNNIKNSEEYKIYFSNKISNGIKNFLNNGGKPSFLGKKHNEITKLKIGELSSINQKGNKNSQFGTILIHNLTLKQNKRIKKEDFFIWEKDGWIKGGKFNFELNFCLICKKEILKKSKFCSNKCCVEYKKENNIYINNFKNKKHSEETKNKMKNHTRNNGINNPMYGMKYIYNPETLEYKRCKEKILEEYLKLGWLYGKKPKK